MVKISKREKKLAKQTLNTMQEVRHKEQLRLQDPNASYKRKISYTTMPWPLELISMGRKDVLGLIILVILLLASVIIVGLYFLIEWLLGVLPW